MELSQIDLAILLPAFAAAWNLAGGNKTIAVPRRSTRPYRAPDGSFSLEVPEGWEHRVEEAGGEVTFLHGEVSVNVSVAQAEDGDAIDQCLEINKALLRHLCPTAEIWAEGTTMLTGATGAYFTMYCPGPRVRTVVRISAALCRNQLIVFKFALPSAELYAAQTVLDRMVQSLKVNEGQTAGREPRRRAC
jgi:hypothetical protein